MKIKQYFSMIRMVLLIVLAFVLITSFAGCVGKVVAQTPDASPIQSPDNEPVVPAAPVGKATVFFTSDINPMGLMAVYQALGVTPTGKVGVKITTGEPPNSNYFVLPAVVPVIQVSGL